MRRRTRGGRMLALGMFFFIYSAINVYSASDVTISPNGDIDIDSNKESTISQKFTTAIPPSEDISVSPSTVDSGTSTTTTAKSPTVADGKRVRTYRQKRNCTPPAIEQFPPPLFPPWFREHGGLILHILIAIFTFLGLAIVCDDYFVSSLDRICEGI